MVDKGIGKKNGVGGYRKSKKEKRLPRAMVTRSHEKERKKESKTKERGKGKKRTASASKRVKADEIKEERSKWQGQWLCVGVGGGWEMEW